MRKDPIEQLLRALYSAALYLLVPVTVYHLIWRGFRQPEYFQRWNERYAAYGAQSHAETVWIHAVSVGEVGAAAPLINALLRERPDLRLLVSRSEEHTSELPSLMRHSYAVFCLRKERDRR